MSANFLMIFILVDSSHWPITNYIRCSYNQQLFDLLKLSEMLHSTKLVVQELGKTNNCHFQIKFTAVIYV